LDGGWRWCTRDRYRPIIKRGYDVREALRTALVEEIALEVECLQERFQGTRRVIRNGKTRKEVEGFEISALSIEPLHHIPTAKKAASSRLWPSDLLQHSPTILERHA
jgi:hypothetical protein